jgi:hypothetical protein
VSDFSVLTLTFAGIGLAIYGAIVFYAGTRKLWWLAILVTLPAAMGGMMYLFMPEVPPEAPFLFRHFGWAVVGQFTIGALVYLAGRLKVRGATNQKDQTA